VFCFDFIRFVLFCFVLLAVTMGCSNGHTSIGLCCVMEMRGKERRGEDTVSFRQYSSIDTSLRNNVALSISLSPI
jgi:hypothetical protein